MLSRLSRRPFAYVAFVRRFPLARTMAYSPFDPENLTDTEVQKLKNSPLVRKLTSTPEALEALQKTMTALQKKGVGTDNKMGIMAQIQFFLDPEVRKELKDST